MSLGQPSMRRIPDEQFFDLHDWASEKAEDYGDKPSMVVHSMVLDKREKVGTITGAIHDGNVVLVDFSPMASDRQVLHKVLAELERAVADVDGDLVGVSRQWLVVAPRGVRVARDRLGE